ncbi:MAG: ribokinase, partial [Chloroflexi bacterium]|nr:ribokinase [Chloroflexota bacterium]
MNNAKRTARICMVGSCMVDLISRVPRLPQPGETLAGASFSIGYGGKGANQAVMAARLGAQVAVVVRLGHDVFGENTLGNFRAQGIDTAYVTFDDTRFSGVAPIAVDQFSGQNAIIIVPGANSGLTPEVVRVAEPAISAADVIICQCEIPVESSLEAFRIAKRNPRCTTILNPAPAPDALPDELLRLTDLLAPNESEAERLTGLRVLSMEEAAAAAAALQKRGPQHVVITLGERGALLASGHTPVMYVPAGRVQVVDTTGAGDAFIGSLACFIGEGRELAQAVQWACRIATQTVLTPGTQTSMPTRAQVAHLLV